jgi:hypothetical protein
VPRQYDPSSPLDNLIANAVLITTEVVCSNPAHGEVYSMQLYVMMFVSNLEQVPGFLRLQLGYHEMLLVVALPDSKKRVISFIMIRKFKL